MAYHKRSYNNDGQSAEGRALEKFAELMIDKIKSIQTDWHKPWFCEGSLKWPKNLSGREYNGMNALGLMLHCEKNGYKIPVFCTFRAPVEAA
ncbi:MAG: ArdC family protein [Clostridium sp.]|nr:ArdC family protein [Clostridium sp.]